MERYITVGMHFEERNLTNAIGAEYEEYRRRVPALL